MGVAAGQSHSHAAHAAGDRLSDREPLEGSESLWRRIHRTHLVDKRSAASFTSREQILSSR